MIRRKSINHPQLIRISKIHRRILAGRYPNSNELAQELESSVITISRDIEFMRDSMMAPIAYDAAERGYYYTEKFDMPNYVMSDKDVEIIASAKMLLSHFQNTPLYEDACNIIDLLSSTAIKHSSGDYIKRIALPASPQIKYDKELWNTLWNAIRQNKIVEFDYNGRWNKETTHRRVRPYQLLMDEGIFLFGFAEERNGERLFALSRIRNLKVLNDTFELPDDFAFESHSGGGKFGAFCSDKADEYQIEFYGDTRPLIREIVLADDETITEDEERDATIVKFTSTQYLSIQQWILSFGCRARPVAPEWFVEEWKTEIGWMHDLTMGKRHQQES